MTKFRFCVLLLVGFAGLAYAASPNDKNVLVMDSEDGGLWRSFEATKECLGLRGMKLFDKSDPGGFRWALAVAGNGRGDSEVLLMEMPTKHNVFFGTKLPKAVERACRTIKQELRDEEEDRKDSQ